MKNYQVIIEIISSGEKIEIPFEIIKEALDCFLEKAGDIAKKVAYERGYEEFIIKVKEKQ